MTQKLGYLSVWPEFFPTVEAESAHLRSSYKLQTWKFQLLSTGRMLPLASVYITSLK